MKIYLLDRNKTICEAWRYFFGEEAEVIKDDFVATIKKHPNIDAVVSPANCFGMMDGGYDYAISNYFGWDLMKSIQKKIIDEYYGIQPIATCISVPIGGSKSKDGNQVYCLHTPVMTVPEKINDPKLIFHAMRNTLIEAERLNVKAIVIPAWGGGCGEVDPYEVAYYMWNGYLSIKNPERKINWDKIEETCDMLHWHGKLMHMAPELVKEGLKSLVFK